MLISILWKEILCFVAIDKIADELVALAKRASISISNSKIANEIPACMSVINEETGYKIRHSSLRMREAGNV